MATGLATRCPACSTVFRVVADQLRVSEGWVRCGRCSEVFNAAQALVDLETGAARRLDAGPPPPPPPESPPAGHEPQDTVAESEPPPGPWSDQGPDDAPLIDTTESRFAADAAEAFGAPAPEPEAPSQEPSFVRRAERARRWRSPRLRAALIGTSALAALALALQAAHAWRDTLAARVPAVRPALDATCALLGCTIAAPRALDAISVENSGLVRVERSNLYRLQIALRNRSAHEVALPAVDLTLSDGTGRLIARRVLQPAEFGVRQTLLPAGRDLALQATLQMAAGDTVAGYTVELFYP